MQPQNRPSATFDPPFDAMMRLEALKEEFAAEAAPKAEKQGPGNLRYRRYVKSVIALVLAAVLGWVPVNRLLVTSSAEATVNARLVTLRAPIDGEISNLSMAADTGEPETGSVLRISNIRTDRSHLDELQKAVDQAEAERETLRQRKVLLSSILQSLRQQTEAYKAARVAQLKARVAELRAQAAGAEAQVTESKAALSRAAALLPNGFLSDANYKKSERDFKVLTEAANATRSRLASADVELDAAQRGIFVGDSYSDTPQSAHRSIELEQQVGEISISLVTVEQRLKQARHALETEQAAFEHRSAAEIALPKHGRVWERMVSSGEQVKHGQELLRVLDCGQAVVTATVSEGNYNKLRLGDPAKFNFRNGDEELEGWIISLNGLAAVPGNFAIDQRAMSREPFHVTVYVPDLANARDCGIGRSGRVVFAKPESRNFAGALLFSSIR